MTVPVRIQRRRVKGWRMPDGARYVGRGTRWGNPYTVATHGEMALPMYRDWLREQLLGDQAFLDPLMDCTALACFCPLDRSCHVDYLIHSIDVMVNWGTSRFPKEVGER